MAGNKERVAMIKYTSETVLPQAREPTSTKLRSSPKDIELLESSKFQFSFSL
jgi:hypothetical protein